MKKHEEKKICYQCKLCDKKYANPSGLRHHIKSIHEGKTYACNICQYQLKTKATLSEHIKVLHLKERQYPCTVCNYKASNEANLTNHVKKIHHRTSKVICKDCNRTIQKSYLAAHRKLLHSGEKQQYHCDFCTFETIYISTLKKHKKIHHTYNLVENEIAI